MARDVYDEWVDDEKELEDIDEAEDSKVDARASKPEPDPDEPDIPDPEPDPVEPDPEPIDPYTQDKSAKGKASKTKPGKVEFKIVGRGASTAKADEEDADDLDDSDDADNNGSDGDAFDNATSDGSGPKTKTRIEDLGLVFKRARISYMWNYVLVLLLVALLALAWPVFGLTFTINPYSFELFWKSTVVLAFGVLCFLLIEEPAIENTVRQYVITNTEVMKIEGVLTKTRVIIPYQSVSDVVFKKTLLGRLLNFGDISVTGFKNEIVFKGVKNPETVYRIIQNKISMMRGGKGVEKKTVVIERVPDKSSRGEKKQGWRDKAKSLGSHGKPGRPKSR
jgi:membrane protein YdbS with pleckstrin-like domain